MRAAVLGHPIDHSLSPALHNAGYRALGLDQWHYGRHDLGAMELARFVAGLGQDWRGLSLTMPLKEVCLEVADEVSATARLAGVGNTLVRRRQGGWLADNTDVGGLVDALLPHWAPTRQVVVLGAGATARSALLALAELGVAEVLVLARRPQQRAGLLEWAAFTLPSLDVTAAELVNEAWREAAVVISTLPAGHDQLELASGEGLVFDAVYAGWPTPFARAAAAAGRQVVGGIDLLVHQAARQFELFCGQPAPIEVMAAVGRAAVAPRRHVVLAGFMGAGKTTVGAGLAERLGRPFVDADDAVVEATGQSVAELFVSLGESGFRSTEARVVCGLLASSEPAVIALGGGGLANPDLTAAVSRQQLVGLQVGLAEALRRVGSDGGRPMLARPDLAELHASRQVLAARLADLLIDVEGRSPQEVIEAVLSSLSPVGGD